MYVFEQGDLFQALLTSSPTAMAIVDRQMCYIAVTHQWTKTFDVGEADIIGTSHYALFPQHGPSWQRIHNACLNGQSGQWQEPDCQLPNGQVVAAQWSIRPWMGSQTDTKNAPDAPDTPSTLPVWYWSGTIFLELNRLYKTPGRNKKTSIGRFSI